jgi:predicted metal-dependent hydrolase
VPRRTSARAVREFVEDNRDWIDRAKDSFAEHFSPSAFVLPDIISLPAIDQRVIVRYQPDPAVKGIRYRFGHGILTLKGHVADEEQCVKALQRWLSGMARKEFAPRLAALAEDMGIPYERMHIRMQRTCWGSRSSSGTISLNLCLLFVAPELLRYLLTHELSHGRHMNHSKRFWQLVARFEPDARKLDKRLGNAWRDVPAWLGIY